MIGNVKMGVKVTTRASNIEYAIRDVIEYTTQLVKDGRKIYYLNIGDPAAFDFKTPQNVKDALCAAVQKDDNYYSPSEGRLDLREAIVRKEKKVNNVDITADKVLITEGISEGIQMILGALVEKGDEILFPGPTYPRTFPTQDFSTELLSHMRQSRRKVGTPTSMTCAKK